MEPHYMVDRRINQLSFSKNSMRTPFSLFVLFWFMNYGLMSPMLTLSLLYN